MKTMKQNSRLLKTALTSLDVHCFIHITYVYFTKLLINLSSEQETFEKKGHTFKT